MVNNSYLLSTSRSTLQNGVSSLRLLNENVISKLTEQPRGLYNGTQGQLETMGTPADELYDQVFERFGCTIQRNPQPTKHGTVPLSTFCLRLVTGRSVIAAKQFHSGDILLRTNPSAFVLKSEWRGQRCDQCFTMLTEASNSRCSACKCTWYCSQR